MLEKHPDLLKYTHIIHSQATPVDEVHIGFVVTVDLSVLPTDEFDFEDAIGNVKQMTARELRAAHDLEGEDRPELETWAGQIGKASCWERALMYVSVTAVAVTLKKKTV